MVYGRAVAFDDLDPAALRAAGNRITAAALHEARLVAAERMAPVLGPTTADPETTVAVLMARDPSDERYDILKAFERRWAILVVRLLEPGIDTAAAIRDARSRGVTVAAIADALGIAHQTVYARYGDQIKSSTKKERVDE